jgi:hypothetical protein
MPKNMVRKMFDRWLAHQHAQFRYPHAWYYSGNGTWSCNSRA